MSPAPHQAFAKLYWDAPFESGMKEQVTAMTCREGSLRTGMEKHWLQNTSRQPSPSNKGQIFLQHMIPPWLVYWPRAISSTKRGMPHVPRNRTYGMKNAPVNIYNVNAEINKTQIFFLFDSTNWPFLKFNMSKFINLIYHVSINKLIVIESAGTSPWRVQLKHCDTSVIQAFVLLDGH